MKFASVPSNAIVADNYRVDFVGMDELAASIDADGLLQLPVVEDLGDGTYLLCDGNRRLIACQMLGWAEIPVMVAEPGEIPDREVAQYVANDQGSPTSPLEDGDRFRRWIDARGWDIATIASKIKRTTRYVEDRVLVSQTSPQTREALRAGLIGIRLAASLAQLDENRQRIVLNLALQSDIPPSAITAKINKLMADQGAEMQDSIFALAVEEWHAEEIVQREREEDNAPAMPMGRAEIADYLGVKVGTVSQWIQRGVIPAPDGRISGNPVWLPATVEQWANETGRVSANI